MTDHDLGDHGGSTAMGVLRVPLVAGDFTPEWMSDALGVRVVGVRAEEIGAGIGIFGIVLRLHLEFDGDPGALASTVIAKLPTTAPANLAVGRALRLYEREVRFYEELGAHVPVRVPKAYYAMHKGDASCLVLEDLTDLRVGDQLVGVTRLQAELVVDALAALHAQFWGRTQAITWMPRLTDPIYYAAVPPIYHQGWPVVRAEYGARIGQEGVSIGDRVDEIFDDLIARCADGTHTLLHTDTRMDNLFFDAGGGDAVALIDWQLAISGRGVSDVVYLVCTSMEPADQDRNWEQLLHRYHDVLSACGVVDYTFGQCVHDYREHALYYLVGAVSIAATFDTGNERGAAMAEAYVRRCFHHAVTCGAADVL